MVKTFKFGEPSKMLSVRVPESRHTEFRDVIQDKINSYFNGEKEGEISPSFKRLYEIMNEHLIDKMTSRQLASIPEDILEEITEMEEMLNGESE